MHIIRCDNWICRQHSPCVPVRSVNIVKLNVQLFDAKYCVNLYKQIQYNYVNMMHINSVHGIRLITHADNKHLKVSSITRSFAAMK